MDFGLNGKVAFVAASSDGLGKATALELAQEGAHVIICGRDRLKLERARDEIVEVTKNDVFTVQGDLTSSQDRSKIINETLKKYPIIDILVTNSGGPPPGKFEELDAEEWQKAFEQLLLSTNDLIRAFLPAMKNQKNGRIIAITSQAVKQPVKNLILSNSIRASVVGLIKTLANELGEYNITVNNVMPGYTKTTRLDNLLKAKPEFKKAIHEVPLQRFAEPHEFAAAVAFLASERASYITGVSLAVDGGWIQSIM